MNAISVTGVVRNGQVVLDGPLDLPDGARVEVVGEIATPIREEKRLTVVERLANLRFMTEEEQSDDPEEIEKWIASWRRCPTS